MEGRVMLHPALTRFLAVLLAILCLILFLTSYFGLADAEELLEDDIRAYNKLTERVATYERLTVELAELEEYKKADEKLSEQEEEHDSTASQHRTDLAEHTAKEGAFKQGADALWEAKAKIDEQKIIYNMSVAEFNKKEAEFEEIREVFKTSGYSRIPVYVDDLDNIVGILYYKDFFTKDFDNIESIIKPVMFVTKTRNVNELMNELQEKKLHLAVVTDEYGSTAGIVTLEDILEEIVGDIWDEHDNVEIEIREVGENKYILSGKASISKVFDELDIDNETESLTVNGWAMDALGRIPVAGDQFEADGLQAKVLKMNGRRIDNLMVIKLEPEEDDEEKED